MPIIDTIKNLFTGGASKLVDSANGLIDTLTLSKEEKEQFKVDFLKLSNEHIQIMEQEATKQMDIEFREMESARKREVDIATSENAPMLNKIITPLLALLVLGSTFLFWYIIIFKELDPKKEILISGIIGSLTTISMGVIGYYFGSSIGSHNKQIQMDKLANK